MRDLNYDLKQLCRHNRDGSYATQADREHILDLIADQLHEMGFRHMHAQSLKPKHVEKLVERWLAEELSPGTIKNRMSALRWWAREDRQGEHRRAHQRRLRHPGSGVRHQHLAKQRSSTWTSSSKFRTPCIQMSLRLQAAFGLRREESIKIVPAWADRGDRAGAQGFLEQGRAGDARFPSAPRSSGNSSTRRRRSPRARVWSRRATPPTATICKHFRYECERVGIHAFHGHRHFYAQVRYQELTGWAVPGARRPDVKAAHAASRRKSIARRGRRSATRWATVASRLPRCIWGAERERQHDQVCAK